MPAALLLHCPPAVLDGNAALEALPVVIVTVSPALAGRGTIDLFGFIADHDGSNDLADSVVGGQTSGPSTASRAESAAVQPPAPHELHADGGGRGLRAYCPPAGHAHVHLFALWPPDTSRTTPTPPAPLVTPLRALCLTVGPVVFVIIADANLADVGLVTVKVVASARDQVQVSHVAVAFSAYFGLSYTA
jgi:hypothetical protein